ncbi:fibronectin type III domain-containing protein [Nocardioides sp. L-11A]|uniref:fibronectin type III domain-containing protein n=1 Tax=Nocardioides sp. L-11A TaxID=3043848 RepID=UPI00249CD23B|nr:fibronectin type III domain-containing protein [Nocardioides sp. L-11A]
MSPRVRRAALVLLAPVTTLLLALAVLVVPAGSATAEPLPPVTNALPPTIGGTAKSGEELRADPGVWQPSVGTTFTYQWLRNGAAIAGATTPAYTPTVGPLDFNGQQISVQVTASHDDHAAGTAVSAAVTVKRSGGASSPTSTMAPAITTTGGGAPVVGVPLSVDHGTWSATGTFARQWLVADIPVPEATGTSYTPLAGDVGKQISVRVYNTVGDLTGIATSAPTDATVGPPSRVAQPTAERGDGRVTVSWAAPADNGSPVTSYTVVASPGGKACAATDALSCTVTGLENGQAYTFTVVASSALGNSPVSPASAAVTPAGLPGAPGTPVAQRGNESATITWPAADGNGAEITDYTVTASPGGREVGVDGATTTATVTGLANGTSYTFTVVATSDVGDSAASAVSNSVVPVGVPHRVIRPTASAGDGSATVTWTAEGNESQDVTKYTVTTTPGGTIVTVAGDKRTATVTGLANGTSYTFTVAATNASGDGPASEASAAVTPAGAPLAVAKPIVARGNESATVAWTAADGNGSPVTGYTVTAAPGGRTATVDGSTTHATVTGLTNGTSYTFTVRATNVIGDGPASVPSAAVVPAAVPAQVAQPGAERRDGAARVTWTAADGNGYAVTTYTVKAAPGGRTVIVDGTSTAATVDGLTNGTAYTFTVVAANTLGAGTVSEPSEEVVPAGRPGTVARPTAVRGNASATVTWAATGGNGSPVTGYTVTAAPGGKTATVGGDVTTATVGGLDNGTAYTFTVTATNDVGDGTPSQPSTAVTPAAVPGQVAAPTATRGDGSAVVAWAPAPANGAAITGYTVTAAPGGHEVVVAGTTALVNGLDNGTAYTFTVTASNALGDGPASVPSSAVTPAGVPGTVAKPTAARGDASAVVTWGAASGNGAAVERYTVLSSPAGAACATTTDLTCTVTGLENGTAYTFTVIATNAVGNSGASAASDPVTPAGRPAPVAKPTAVAADGSATVTWTPGASNGASVTGYTVTAAPGGKTATVGGGTTTATLSGLTNGTAYTFTVAATNPVGTGTPSAASDAVTPAGRPARVARPTAVAADGSVAVTWTAAAANGSPITGYTVAASPGGTSVTVDGGSTVATLSGLANGTAYTVTVTATNAVGAGEASLPSAAVTPEPVSAQAPGAPATVTAKRGDRSATVSWTRADGNGSPITGYVVTTHPGGQRTTVGAEVHEIVVPGLVNGTAYTFTVAATTAAGASIASAPSNSVVPARRPGRVAKPTATVKGERPRLVVKWREPASQGAPLTQYTVHVNGRSWVVAATKRRLVLRNLAPGTYRVSVVAANELGDAKASRKATVRVRRR